MGSTADFDEGPTVGPHGVMIAAGLPIEAAAAWVGHACWAELRFHELLSTWLAHEEDDAVAIHLWSVRAAAAERASAWHRRLPELREMPRQAFVTPSSADVAAFFDAIDAAVVAEHVAGGLAAEVIAGALLAGYESHTLRTLGPADGPVARTLVAARASLQAELEDSDDEAAPLPTGFVPRLP